MTQRPRRGFGIRLKLMLVSSILFLLPVLAYASAVELRRFVLQGQESAQLLAARAVATVLHEREDLFDPRSGLPYPFQEEHRIVADPLPEPILLDGTADDWGGVVREAPLYGERYVLQSSRAYDAGDVGLRLAVGMRGEFVYAFARVTDDHMLYRHPGYLRLDHSDHVRLSAEDADGQLVRYVILAAGPGTGTAYAVREDWRQPLDAAGTPTYGIRSEWRETPQGYDVEIRLPAALLGPEQRIGFVIADVDDADTREVATLLGTVPAPRVEELNRILIRSPEIERILTGLDRPGARIWVVDRQQRVRAVRGSLASGSQRYPAIDPSLRDRILQPVTLLLSDVATRSDDAPLDARVLRDLLVAQALAGREDVRRTAASPGRGILAAAHPIWAGDRPVGAVVVEQSESEVLTVQRRAMENLFVATLVVFAAVAGVLLAFATRLTLRIRRLRNSADAAIDAHGRVHLDRLEAGSAAGDEIGDLARTYSAMLERLSQYTRYLEFVPRALKHEMQNPLNTVSTSLENLAEGVEGTEARTYVEAAQRGVRRLGAILVSLTEAANLEEALQQAPPANLDLNALVARYVANLTTAHGDRRFVYAGPGRPLQIRAADVSIEQMMDKLTDNALDFSPPSGTIAVALARVNGEAQLTVANDGPPLPDALRDQLFESLVSGRDPGAGDRPHLGMGLYAVRVIAELHGGRVEAANRPEGGVVFTVHIPITERPDAVIRGGV